LRLSINCMIKSSSILTQELLPLHLLPQGQVAEIDQLVGKPDHVHRLHELGLRSGVIVEMVQPGSPCIVRLGGQRLCFRQTEALGVLVRPGDVD
jgi:Fe2+ transport system protein FeoA